MGSLGCTVFRSEYLLYMHPTLRLIVFAISCLSPWPGASGRGAGACAWNLVSQEERISLAEDALRTTEVLYVTQYCRRIYAGRISLANDFEL